MLREIWDFLTTKSSWNARKDGYLYTAIALSARARRCQKYWQDHLFSCHQLIENHLQSIIFENQKSNNANSEVKQFEKIQSVVVVGSGLLLETPIDLLQKYFMEVYLVDVVHTKQVRADYGNQKNIHLIELDLNQEQAFDKLLLNLQLPSVDYLLSANLLSQLPLQICKKMIAEKKSEFEVNTQAYQLQKNHLLGTQKISRHGMLFSDYQVQLKKVNQNIIIEESISVDPRLQIQWQNKWDWKLAPAPEVEKDKDIILNVGLITW